MISKGEISLYIRMLLIGWLLSFLMVAPAAPAIFQGKPITLNFKDIEIRAVLQIIADFKGVNLVVTDAVSGNITLRLHDVPWDQALDVILSTQGLKSRELNNILLIDKAASMSARENAVADEDMAAENMAPLQSELLQIRNASALDVAKMLKDATQSMLSSRGSLSVDSRTNSIWVKDTLTHMREIKRMVQQWDVPVKQVMIEARIVNMSKECSQDLGVRWGVSNARYLSGTLEGANQQANGVLLTDTPLSDRLNVDLGALPFDASPATIGIALATLGNHVLLDLELSALEREGRAEIVASPRLMTTNQKPAIIESGEDIPYQQATLSGATAVSFKKAVLSLSVTPQITSEGKLLMELLINQDSDSGRRVQGVPIVLTKSIETSVLVDNGQTIVLGGINKHEKNNAITRVPFLGSLPLVGHLFQRKEIKKRKEELLIFITPKIM